MALMLVSVKIYYDGDTLNNSESISQTNKTPCSKGKMRERKKRCLKMPRQNIDLNSKH